MVLDLMLDTECLEKPVQEAALGAHIHGGMVAPKQATREEKPQAKTIQGCPLDPKSVMVTMLTPQPTPTDGHLRRLAHSPLRMFGLKTPLSRTARLGDLNTPKQPGAGSGAAEG
jgi:hypothetical protein